MTPPIANRVVAVHDRLGGDRAKVRDNQLFTLERAIACLQDALTQPKQNDG